MNTATLHETTAIAATVAAIGAGQDLLLILLSRLRPSSRNVRKGGGASIFAPGDVNRLAKLKKAQIAAEAERLAAGSGWLPVMFRAPEDATESAEVSEVVAPAEDAGDDEALREAA